MKYRYVKVCEHIHHAFIDNEDGMPEIAHILFVNEPERNVVVDDGETYSAEEWFADQEDEWQEYVEMLADIEKARI
jgi:hypothetical protein